MKLYGRTQSTNKSMFLSNGYTNICDNSHFIDFILKNTHGRGVDAYFNFMEEPALDKHQQMLGTLSSYIVCSKSIIG